MSEASEHQEQFIAAVRADNSKLVAEMLADGRVDANAPIEWFVTGLHLAVHRDRAAIANLLIDAGARINDVDGIGATPLLVAVRANRVAMVELLIGRGADVALEDSNHLSPLLVAMLKRSEPNIYALLKAGAPLGSSTNPNDAAVVCAAATLSPRVLRLMMEQFDIGELRDDSRRTPCHHLAAMTSSQSPQADVVLRMLVNEAHVDIDARNDLDETCAHICAMHGHEAALHVAIEVGADVDARDRSLRTPLMHAVANLHLPCVYLLLAAEAAVDVRGRMGETLCHLAVNPFAGIALRLTRPPLQMLCTTIAAGADFDAPDERGTSARAFASKHGIPAPSEQDIDNARHLTTVAIINLVRKRALQICLGLQPLQLDALQTCEVLQHACAPWSAAIPFHTWWSIATTVKHFHR